MAALKRTQNAIPAHDLAIQVDRASEFAFFEGAVFSPLQFSLAKEGLVGRVVKLAKAVHEGVHLVFRLC